jgi:ATP-dependent DNA helicase RecG
LDIDEINAAILLYKAYKANSNFEDVEDFLIQMGLIQNGNLTNACIVLFAKHPNRFRARIEYRTSVINKSTF